MTLRTQQRLGAAGRLGCLLVLLVIGGYPLFWTAASSFRPAAEITARPWGLPLPPSFANYRNVLAKHQIDPGHFLMVGNSLRSDILPVVSLGARAVHIPYHITWEHEKVPLGASEAAEYLEIEHIGLLLEVVARLEQGAQPQSP